MKIPLQNQNQKAILFACPKSLWPRNMAKVIGTGMNGKSSTKLAYIIILSSMDIDEIDSDGEDSNVQARLSLIIT